ncbi:MAG: LysM peptidoglycan-binding domain-containing protein [Lentisphaeria bacterium]|nr:LysM peptidoglycan-binding domain-containing protein [Lentisphaeria bacterium]
MKATRIVIPASAAVAAIILTACADKPVRIPGGSFVEEPYTGETTSRSQTIPSNGENTLETEVIYIEDDVPVGPVEDNTQAGQQGGSSAQGGAAQGGDTTAQQGGTQLQPVEQEPATKNNAPEGSVEYKVVKGDTLWGIGMVYGVSVARLAEINGISEKSTLKVGQILMIPPDAKNAVGKPVQKKPETKPASTTKADSGTKSASTTKPAANTAKPVAKDGETLYVVKSGDNLSMIAYRHHVKLADLIAANKVDPKATLRIGQTLVIPAAGAKAASSTTKPATTTKTDSGTKPATTTKPATATTTKTEPATTTKPATTTPSATTTKGGEGSGGIVEPIGGGSMGGTSSTSTPAATTKPAAGSATSGLASVSALDDADIFAVPIDSESTLEEVANIHDKNLEDLIRLNPEFKPGQKIPAGTAIKMPLF